jgi:hypothetical protein
VGAIVRIILLLIHLHLIYRLALNGSDRCVNLARQFVNEFTDLVCSHDKWWRNQGMIALTAIDGFSHGMATEPSCHRFLLHPGMKLERRIERSPGRSIGNQLKSPE